MRFNYFDMLSGEPIFVDGVGHLCSPRLRQICPSSGIGYGTYALYLNFLSWDKEKLLKYDSLIGLSGAAKLERETLTVYDAVVLLKETRALCLKALSFFMTEEIVYDDKNRCFISFVRTDNGVKAIGEITRDNFEEIKQLIRNLNFIGLNKEDEPVKHSSEQSKLLWEQVQQCLKEESEKSSGEDRPEYHIGNIISKLCVAHPSYNYLNVFDLTVFQLYDAFFQLGFIRSSNLNERIFSNHGGEKFRFEDWLRPIIQKV